MFNAKIDQKKLETFFQINSLINSHYKDLKSLLTLILESATQLTESEASSLLMVDPDRKVLKFEVALGAKGQEVQNYTVPIGEGIAGWVAQRSTSLVVHDVQGDPRFFSEISKSVGFTTKSILAVPLKVKDNCVGVLEMLNKRAGEYFDEDDLTWLENFATQAAIAIQNARNYQEITQELNQLKSRIGSHVEALPPQSASMVALEAQAKKFSLVDSGVLLQGESGVGKEVIADLIHYSSPRAQGPYIKLNCAALPESLLESELFGHVRGAFTDAYETRKGKFEQAHGGSLFLDEVGEIPLGLQAKLLRALQSKIIEPIGAQESVFCDVRIIAATNQNLKAAVDAGQFRQDLYYRLNVLPLFIPPLRERREDILPLAQFFVLKHSQKQGRSVRGLSKEAETVLQEYPWPGNVRELENVIERSVVLGRGEWIEAPDLNLVIGDPAEKPEEVVLELKDALNEFKDRHIRRVLQRFQGNQTKASQALGIQRTYLSKLLKESENLH